MCALCRVEEGTVAMGSLSGISKRAPLGVAYCLAIGYARTGTYSVPGLTAGTFLAS